MIPIQCFAQSLQQDNDAVGLERTTKGFGRCTGKLLVLSCTIFFFNW